MLDTRSRDEQRMVYPTTPPSSGVFVAIRGDGTVIGDPDDELGHPGDARPLRSVRARPIVPEIPPDTESGESGESGGPPLLLITPSNGPGPSTSQPEYEP